MTVFFLTNWCFKADRFFSNFQNLPDLVDWHFHFYCDLFGSWFTTNFLNKISRSTNQLIDGLDHMDRNTNSSCLVCNRASNCLTNPPCCVSRKFVTAAVFEFVDRLHEADISLLNEIQELKAPVGVFFRNT